MGIKKLIYFKKRKKFKCIEAKKIENSLSKKTKDGNQSNSKNKNNLIFNKFFYNNIIE